MTCDYLLFHNCRQRPRSAERNTVQRPLNLKLVPQDSAKLLGLVGKLLERKVA